MPIPLNRKLKRITKAVRLKSNLNGNDNEWMVWAYCGIYKNRSAESQPNALVAFRELSSGNLSENVILRRLPLTSLGQVRIGTVWQDSICRSEVVFDAPEEPFSIDFTKSAWKLTSFHEAAREQLLPPYPQSIYQPPYSVDKNWFIEFPLSTGGKLVIPCIEFFSRCYGRSEELKRVLATYPWDAGKETAENRLFAPLDEPEEPGKWKIKLRKRLVNSDIVLLAHAKYDRYTMNAAKSIYAQIEAQHDPENKKPAFIKVAPWFQGPAQLKVKGIWFDNKRSFLALQVIGCSEPDGLPISRDRENYNKVDNPAVDGGNGDAWKDAPQRALIKPPEIIDLTGDDEPDHGAAPIEVQNPDFVVLGQPRVIIDVRRERAKGSAGKRGNASDATTFSSGEPHGSNKGVSYASINAPQIMESHGTLRDMWEALLLLGKKRPDLIQSVEWFTFKDGFNSHPEPKLITLQPFDKDDEVSAEIRNWLFYDISGHVPRGILVARIMATGKLIHIIEIARKPRTKKDEDGNAVASEETFKGFVFVLDDQRQFESWLKQFMSGIRHVKGIVEKLVRSCPGVAAAFKHPAAKAGLAHCEASVFNALEKVGINKRTF